MWFYEVVPPWICATIKPKHGIVFSEIVVFLMSPAFPGWQDFIYLRVQHRKLLYIFSEYQYTEITPKKKGKIKSAVTTHTTDGCMLFVILFIAKRLNPWPTTCLGCSWSSSEVSFLFFVLLWRMQVTGSLWQTMQWVEPILQLFICKLKERAYQHDYHTEGSYSFTHRPGQ